MKQKGFAPILILILIALAIVGYFGYKNYRQKLQTLITLTPTANLSRVESKDWKTYTNTRYGYSIKYPPTWQTKKVGGTIGPEPEDVSPEALELRILNPYPSKPFPDGVIFIQNAFSPTFGSDWKKTLVTMNEIEFSKFEKEGKKNLQSTVFVTKTSSKPDYDYGDSYLEITLQYSLTNPEKDIVDQILSTFKFLGQ